jgi:hypothetical protein
LHFEHLLGETAVREIVKVCCKGIWNCLKATDIPEKTEDDWVSIDKDFYRRSQFPNCIGAVDGKRVRIKMPTDSGSLFYNYKHFFSILLLASVDANYCFTAADVGEVGKSGYSNVFLEFKYTNETRIKSTGNPREQAVA